MNQSIWLALDRASRNLERIINDEVSHLGLSTMDCHVLLALYANDGIHASTLAATVSRQATSFTPNLDSLERKGLIERRNDPNDRRAVFIFLTTKARAIEESVREGVNEAVAYWLECVIPETDMQAFDGIIEILGDAKL